MKIKVLHIWKPGKELIEYLENGLSSFPDIELIFPKEPDENFFLEQAPTANIIVGWRPSEELLAKAEDLKLFINPGAGVQHQIKPFKKLNSTRNVVLVNGHGNAYFTAQHAVALLLSLTNRVIPHHNWMKEGKWRFGDNEAASIPLRKRKVGLLGYGAVNQKVHNFLKGFDLTFAALKRNWDDPPDNLTTYHPENLMDFLNFIDTLIVTLPQTSQTEDLLGEKELRALGKNGLLVQLGRGLIINEKALYTALKNNLIEGAAIDVWYNYKPLEDDLNRKFPFHFPFHELDNVVLSPHRAASPFSDLERWNEVVENIIRFHNGREDFLNIVDLNREY